MVEVAPPYDQTGNTALVGATNFLNARLVGRTLEEARAEIDADIASNKAQLDELTGRVVATGLASWSGGDAERALIVRGQANLLDDVTAVVSDASALALDELVDTAFAGRPAETIPFILLRHASAGSKRRWSGNDLDRPLDADGAAHAERLAGLLSCFGSCRVISSAAERCVATVRPYAELTGGSIEIEAGLTMPQPGGGTARELKRAAQIIDDGKPAVICAHGENLPSLLQAACARLGARPPKGPPLRKAAWWVLHTAGGALAGAERYHPADT